MNCPFCTHKNTKVLDSRLTKKGFSTRRRRLCISCDARFTTYESIEIMIPRIHKKDGRREDFNKEKLRKGIEMACQKLQVSPQQIEEIVAKVQEKLSTLNVPEVGSIYIGNIVMSMLKEVHPVAYVRFASVYKSFDDIDEFFNNLKKDTFKESKSVDQQL